MADSEETRVEPEDDASGTGDGASGTEDDEGRRYRGVRVLGNCEHCGMPLPLTGPLRQVPCTHCLETNRFTAAFWEDLLDRLDWNPRNKHVPGEYDLDVTIAEPPAALRERSSEPPDWLVVPSLRRLFGAQQEAPEPSVVVDDSARPVVMSCPKCSATLDLDEKSKRLTTCGDCGTDVYLPDDLWRRLHPVKQAERWYVEYEGPSSVARRRRQEEAGAEALCAAAERQELQLRRERLLERRTQLRRPPPRRFSFVAWALLLSILLTAAGWFAGDGEDPALGLHARLLCPRLCDGCTGPYEDGQCTAPDGTVPVPGGRLTLLATAWAPLFLLCLLGGLLIARRRRARKRRKNERWLAQLDEEEATLEDRLADLDPLPPT